MKEHPSKHIRAYFNDTTCLKASCFDIAYISQNIYLYATLWNEIYCKSFF